MTITISTQILPGNLGDGWIDNSQAADELAVFTKAIWTKDLLLAGVDLGNVTFDIDVCHNTSSCSRDFSVDVYHFDDVDAALEQRALVEDCLTPDNEIWERFCDESSHLWADD